jgi:hypothetical protein
VLAGSTSRTPSCRLFETIFSIGAAWVENHFRAFPQSRIAFGINHVHTETASGSGYGPPP